MTTDARERAAFLDRDVGPLCCSCGMCCWYLSALVTKEEAETIAQENGLEQRKFCHREKKGEGPNPGRLVLNMPCRFLLGRPTEWVSCRIYTKTRPGVCRAYLCRIALQYKIGIIEIGPARRLLRQALVTHQPSIFNWVGADGERELQRSMVVAPLREEAARMIKDFGHDGHLGELDAEEVGDILIAKSLTPTYLVHSDLAHLELNLLLNFFDRGDHELTDILRPHVIEGWTPEQRAIALRTYTAVLAKLRALFRTADELQEESEDAPPKIH